MSNIRKQQEILSRLYQQRILSFELISTYMFLSEGLSESYCRKTLKAMLDSSLIRKRTDIKNLCCYELASKGVKFLREHGLLPLGTDLVSFGEELLTPCKIKVDAPIVSHQLALNAFVLRFANEFRDISFEYYDEKFCSFFPHVRPDGMIQVGNTLYFLEMDMGTERSNRLVTKWRNYRMMLNSTFYGGLTENIKVLFILDKKSKAREKKLKKWIDNNLLDKVTARFDILIGDTDYLMDYLSRDIVGIKSFPKELNYFSRVEDFSSKYTDYFSYHSYLTLLENDSIKQEDGVYLEFLYDDYMFNSMYVYRKIKELNRVNQSNETLLGRELKYVVLVPDERAALELLLLSDAFSLNLFFVTPERLSLGIYKGFFRIERDGTICHFEEHDFCIPVPEQRIGNLEIKKSL